MLSSLDESIAKAKKGQQRRVIIGVMSVVVVVLIVVVISTLGRYQKRDQSGAVDSSLTSAGSKASISRDEVQKQLFVLSEQLKQSQLNRFLVKWGEVSLDELEVRLAQAYRLYGESQYPTASNLADEIAQGLTNLQTEFDALYTSYYEQADKAYQNQDIDEARRLNALALELYPQFSLGKKLQQKLDVYASIRQHSQDLKTAIVENDLNKQQSLLKAILQLDPENFEISNQLSKVDKQLRDIDFSNAFGRANQAFTQNDFGLAQRYLSDAQKIDPSRSETTLLKGRIEKALTQLNAAQLEQQISIFAQSDEWETVKIIGDKALERYPENSFIQSTMESANNILRIQDKLVGYQARPLRLRDANIRNNAQVAIQEARQYFDSSAMLAATVEQLQDTITQENRPIAVTIQSDNRTIIKVLGMGIIGQTESKQIELKPGTYKLEGTRQGYKTEIVTLVVEQSENPIEIDIRCTQKV
jgi:hypothetical protein